jgi:hypothetical protein
MQSDGAKFGTVRQFTQLYVFLTELCVKTVSYKAIKLRTFIKGSSIGN